MRIRVQGRMIESMNKKNDKRNRFASQGSTIVSIYIKQYFKYMHVLQSETFIYEIRIADTVIRQLNNRLDNTFSL